MSEFRFEEEEYSAKVSRRTIGRIFGLLRPYRMQVILFILAVSVVSSVESFFTYLGKEITDVGIIGGNREALFQTLALYLGMIFIQAAFVFAFIYLCGRLGQIVKYDIRKKTFEHLQTLSLSYYDKTPVGWIISRVMSDSDRMSDLVTWGLLDTTWAVVNILTAMFFMLTINWQLTLIVMLIVPVLIVAAGWFQTRILKEYRQSRKFNSQITASYNENINGVRIVKAQNREEANLAEFQDLSRGMRRSSYRAAWYSALFLPSVQLIASFAVGAVALYGGFQVNSGWLTLGGIQAFIQYITFMMWPIQDMAEVYASMQHAIASAERTFALQDTKAEIVNRPGAIDPGSITGDVEFDGVTFYYSADKPVLEDLNLKVKQGEMIALVGATGSGKSTIVNLLCRFYEPRAGVIRIAGHDYTTLTLDALQSRIGVVLQTPHLFSGTIRENIRYGKLTASHEAIEQAARTAGADEFIRALPNGYDEQVGEGGILLSVGQKQLISLARVVLADPQILVMDEATSSIDTLTEHLVQAGMDRVMEGRTSFVIAHRLSTIKRASRILVIERGRVIEQGTHAELLRIGGHYYDLYTNQFRHEKEAAYNPFAEADALAAANGHTHAPQREALAAGAD